MSYASAVLADSPAVYLEVDEASGTTAADTSGNARDFTATNVTWAQASLFADASGTSVLLNGSTAHLGRTSAAWMNSSLITCEFRYKHVAAAGTRLFVGRWGSSGARPWLFQINNNKLAIQINGSGVLMSGATTLVDGQTYTVAWRSNGTNVHLFLDGVIDGTLAHAGPTDTSGDLEIGRAAGSAYAPGQFDGFAFWSGVAVADSRLLAHHNAAIGAAGITVSVDASASTWTAPPVSVPITTDNSNGMGGWQLGGYATARVTTPVAANPVAGDVEGIELELAKFLPPPTIVNGEVQ